MKKHSSNQRKNSGGTSVNPPFFQPKVSDNNFFTKKDVIFSSPIQKKKNENLPEDLQEKMENSLGQDFSNINIQKNSEEATDINALAFTRGDSIHFAPGEFNPNSEQGRNLIGHEFTHIAQQRSGKVGTTSFKDRGLNLNKDKVLENEADDFGRKAIKGEVIPKYKSSNITSNRKNISANTNYNKSVSNSLIQRQRRPRISDPAVVSAVALGSYIRLTFNLTWTRDEVVSYLWPNHPNPSILFFMPDESDPWRTETGEYLSFLIVPSSSVLQGIRSNVHRMIYESIPEFNAHDVLPNWVPDGIRTQIQEGFNSGENIHLYGRWTEQENQYTQGLYWMRRRGSRTQIQVSQLPDPSIVRDRRLREAQIIVNQYITNYVVSEGLSISEAKTRTRERTRRELVISILEAIEVVIPGRIPSIVVPRSRPSIVVPNRRPPRVTQTSGRQPRATRLSNLVEQARDMVRRIRQAGREVIANMGGAGASHEPPWAININNQTVGRRGITNHINADASDIGQLFETNSIDGVVGHHMPPDVIDWERAVSGIFDVLSSGGTFRFDWRGATVEATQVAQLLREAGFINVQNLADALVTAVKP